MKRNKIVAGNWKMNMTLDESIELSNALIKSSLIRVGECLLDRLVKVYAPALLLRDFFGIYIYYILFALLNGSF